MKSTLRLRAFVWLFLLAWSAAAPRAETIPVYFGTGGPGAKGLYRATFDTEKGKLTPAVLAVEIGSAGFLALHPDGDKLYAVANVPGGPGAAAYRIGQDGALDPINTSPTGDGGQIRSPLKIQFPIGNPLPDPIPLKIQFPIGRSDPPENPVSYQ